MNRTTLFCGLFAAVGALGYAFLGHVPTLATVSLVFGVVFFYRLARGIARSNRESKHS